MQVTTIGAATIDVVVSGAHCTDIASGKHDVESITFGIGGGAVNAGLAFAVAGARVHIACALGMDVEGDWIRATLARESVDLSLVQSVADVSTGKAVIQLDAKDDVSVFAQRGASALVSPRRALGDMAHTDLLYVTALSVQAEAELAAVLARADAHRPLVAINPGMKQLEMGSDALSHVLHRADLVAVNEDEARVWAVRRGVRLPGDLLAGGSGWMSTMLSKDGQAMLVTLGERGALFHDGKQIHFSAAKRVPVHSTLGAGDAFGATLAFHWAERAPTRVALAAAHAYCGKVLQVRTANLAQV